MSHDLGRISDLFVGAPSEGFDDTPEEILDRKGTNSSESTEIANIFLQSGQYERALEHFKRAVEQAEPEDLVQKQNDLAAAYAFGDHDEEALKQYQLAKENAENNPEPEIGIAEIYKQNGKVKEAVEHLYSAMVLQPKNPYLPLKIAETLKDFGYPRKALEFVQKSIEIKSESSYPHFLEAELLFQLEHIELAISAYHQAILREPSDDFLYLRLSVAQWRAGKHQEAIKSIRLASELAPKKNLYHGILEELFSYLGQLEESNLESERADQMDSFDLDMLQRVFKDLGFAIKEVD